MFGALPFLEVRLLRNRIRAILKSPLRLLMWLGWGLYIGFMTFLRTRGQHTGLQQSLPTAPLATTIAGALLLFAGLTVFAAAGGSVRPFRLRSDATFFARAGVSSRTLVLWLQLRAMFGRSWYFIAMLVFYSFAFVPARSGISLVAAIALLAGLATLAVTALQLPTFLLAIRGYRRLARGIAMVLLLYGVVLALAAPLDIATHMRELPALLHAFALRYHTVVSWAPGDLIRSALSGNPFVPIGLITVAALATAFTWVLSGDVYPELYEAATRVFDRVERVRRGETQVRLTHATSARRVPIGAAVLLWKNGIVFARSGGRKIVLAVSAVIWLGVSVLLGFALRDADSASVVVAIAPAILLLAAVGFTTSFAIAEDVGKPFWWLTGGSLFRRLLVWTIGETRRSAVIFAAGVGVEMLVAGYAIESVSATIAAISLWWMMYAVGVLVYILLPAQLDRSGPGFALRFFVVGMVLVPPLLVFAVVLVAMHAPTIACIATALTAIGVGCGSIALGATRLAHGGGATFARAAAE